MKRTPLFIVMVFAAASLGRAQPTQAPAAHAPDGGTRETLISIAVPVLTNSPFSAVVETEWIKMLPDGSTATTQNRRRIARDSSGRVYEERFYLRPASLAPRIQALQVRDPNRHEFINCDVEQHVCTITQFMGRARTSMPTAVGPPGSPNTKDEPLGEKLESGLNLVGTREITTVPAGGFGNTQPEPIVKEFWYSPVLGVNLVTKRFDPRHGSQNFLVTNVSQTEPDPKLFDMPSGYRVIRLQGAAQGAEITP